MSAIPYRADDQLDRVVDAIGRLSASGPKQIPGGVRLCCPAHEDHTPSLDITRGSDQPVLVKCWAGCETADVLAAAGLTWADVSNDLPEPPAKTNPFRHVTRAPKPTVVKRREHVYTDIDGTPLYRVVRTSQLDGSKRIHQERREGDRWVSGINAKDGQPLVPYVPYRLPRLVAGVSADALIFIVEGETCVEAAESLGFIATTNHGGAGKWRPEYAEYLRGARVVILPDNDDAGHAHADAVATNLAPVAASVTVIDIPGLPEKGDLADFVTCGGTADEIRQLVAAVTPTPHTGPAPVISSVPQLDQAALYGPIGNVVKALEPTTEASQAALLAYLLVGYGAMLGRQTTANIWGEPQHANLYMIVTGASAAARKSTAARAVRPFLNMLEPDFLLDQGQEGLASGEAVVEALKDDPQRPDKDRRMLVNEDEFTRLLEVTKRQGNTLATLLLSAWDGTSLGTNSKAGGRIRVTDPHIAVIGNAPDSELRHAMHGFASGFANRFMYVLVDSPHDLPFPTRLPQSTITGLAAPLFDSYQWATTSRRELELDDTARGTYEVLYRAHRTSQRQGNDRVTNLRAREISNLVRIALIYAITDRSETIKSEHLLAAGAFIDYANDSIQALFGLNEHGLSERAATILTALRRLPRDKGLARTEVRSLFSNNLGSGEMDSLVAELVEANLVVERNVASGRGRPTKTIYLI